MNERLKKWESALDFELGRVAPYKFARSVLKKVKEGETIEPNGCELLKAYADSVDPDTLTIEQRRSTHAQRLYEELAFAHQFNKDVRGEIGDSALGFIYRGAWLHSHDLKDSRALYLMAFDRLLEEYANGAKISALDEKGAEVLHWLKSLQNAYPERYYGRTIGEAVEDLTKRGTGYQLSGR